MTLWRVQLASERKTILAWSAGTGAYLLLMGLLYTAMGGGEGLSELADSYPPDILEALGIGELGTVIGFASAEFSALAPLVFGIFLVMFMTRRFAGAEEDGSIDHLMARPISRSQYYWHGVLIAATTYGAILLAAAIGAVIGFAAEATGKDMLGLLGLMADLIPFGAVFIGIGALLGTLFHRRAKANGIGAGIVVVSFATDLASRLVDGADWLQYVSPIGLLGRSNLAEGELDVAYVLISFTIAAATLLGAWIVHERKQLYA